MRAILSFTENDNYLFFLPITTFCWNKLNADCIVFYPGKHDVPTDEFLNKISPKFKLVLGYSNLSPNCFLDLWPFESPKHKEATYAQCSRLYAATLDLPEDEILVTSDIDMAIFKLPPNVGGRMTVFGVDLVPDSQYPICYASGKVQDWRKIIGNGTYQEHLDNLLGNIEAEHFRGNYWGKDQETLFNILQGYGHAVLPRAKPGTQFATNRLDRDDAYLLDRLNPDIIDYHMPRPGYEENNFNQILTVFKYFYPDDNFDWLIEYRNKYIELL